MVRGHFKRINKAVIHKGIPDSKYLEIQHDLFDVRIVFQANKSHPKVWKFLKYQISKEFQGFQEVAEAIMNMSQEELDMLDCG